METERREMNLLLGCAVAFVVLCLLVVFGGWSFLWKLVAGWAALW